MRFKTKREALSSINARTRTVNGVAYPLYEVYLGINIITKKCERLYAASKPKLVELIEDFYRAREQNGDLASVLGAEQIFDARAAMKLLADAHVDLTLLDCAKHEIERLGRATQYTKLLGEAYDEFIDAKALNSELEIKKTECTTGKFVCSVGRDRVLSSITIEDVAGYIHANFDNAAPRTYNSHVAYIKTFLSWCADAEHKFIPENPALPMKAKPVAWKRPKYLKPDDVKRLFDILWSVRDEHPDYLALAVTQFFIGVRREEAIRMAENPDTATVLIDDATFRVDGGKGHTKGIAPRAAHLSENAVAWMRSFDYMEGIQDVTERTTDNYYTLARAKGVPMFKNCARHTFITMHVAKFHTPEVTQAMVGTSGTMRAVHYDGLAPQKEGEAYFAIMPPTTPSPSVS